jgi:uncharacterized protein DUF6113
MPSAGRLFAHALAFVGGLAAGLLGSFVHGYTAYGVPVGLLTGLGLSLSVFVVAGVATRSRSGAALAAAGWLLVVLALSVKRPEGDLVVPGTGLGYAWLLGGTVLAGVALSWPYALLPPDDRRPPSADRPFGR